MIELDKVKKQYILFFIDLDLLSQDFICCWAIDRVKEFYFSRIGEANKRMLNVINIIFLIFHGISFKVEKCNIVIYMRMTKSEICRKFDKIVDFSVAEKLVDTILEFNSFKMILSSINAISAYMGHEISLVDEVLLFVNIEIFRKEVRKENEISRDKCIIENQKHVTLLVFPPNHYSGDIRHQDKIVLFLVASECCLQESEDNQDYICKVF